MVYIYILLLEQEKYYVGKTTNPEFRLERHFNSGGSEWTIKYKPIKVLEIIKDCDGKGICEHRKHRWRCKICKPFKKTIRG